MGSIVLWWLALEALGWITFPLLFPFFHASSSRGYPLARIFALILVTYVSWLFAYAVSLGVVLPVTLAAVAAAGAIWGVRQKRQIRAWLGSGGWQSILRTDALWTFGFLFFCWQRAVNPEIFQQEKYMDFAFFNALMRTDVMPPPDPWMSGKTFNYYYFGYLMFADLARLIPLPPGLSYNLCVATIAGLTFSQTAMLALRLTKRWGLAVLGGAMCILLGNLDGFLQFLERGTVRGMNFWRSSRILDGDNTINEFPFFSSIHGDLHPHFMVMPMSMLLLAILLDEKLYPSRAAEQPRSWKSWLLADLLVAFVFGAMVATSTWELPVGALLIAALIGRSQPLLPLLTRDRLLVVARVVAIVIVARYVLFLPSYLAVSLSPGGVGAKFATTSWREFLTIFGALLFAPALLVLYRAFAWLPGGREVRHFAAALLALLLVYFGIGGNAVFPLLAILFAAALIAAYANAGEDERAGFLLIAIAVSAVLACEIVYIRDAYGERLYRMNTVFKFYFQAWLILSLAAPWALSRMLEARWGWRPGRYVFQACVALLVSASACYPIGITADRSRLPKTLDGNAYLNRPETRDDYAAIRWFRENVRGMPVILEASGPAYSYFARIASNTGLPTVMGWANHEGLWRSHDPEVTERVQHVHRMYTALNLEDIRSLVERYKVEYVVVGALEKQHYGAAGMAKFSALEVAFSQGATTVYRVR